MLSDAHPGLTPLPYHCELREYLKTQERDLWQWFASAQAQADYADSLRLELLKATYRLEAESHPDLYRSAEEASRGLQLEVPLTIYQAQQTAQANAALYYLPGEAHLVLAGPVLSLLSANELKSVLGHELAHFLLWQEDHGEFHIADRLLQAIAHDPRAEPSQVQSARWYQLYTEIFADRGSLRVAGEVQTVVAGLVKIQTGLAQVSAASYLKQADEIFQKSTVKTAEMSHPEAFIRARALALWAEGNGEADHRIRAMIEGAAVLEELDLVRQERLTQLTRRLLAQLLRPKWFQSDAVLGYARRFFDDFCPATDADPGLVEALKFSDPKLREYLCYLLLDFAVADPALEDLPLATALEFSRPLELESLLEKLATRELKWKPRDLRRLKAEAAELLAKAEVKP